MPVVTDISSFESVPIVEKEVFHYLGVPESKLVDFDTFKKAESELSQKVNCAITEMKSLLLPKAVYSTYKLDNSFTGQEIAVTAGKSFTGLKTAKSAGWSVIAPETAAPAGKSFTGLKTAKSAGGSVIAPETAAPAGGSFTGLETAVKASESFIAPESKLSAGESFTATETEQKTSIAFGPFDITSHDLVKNLSGCKTVTVFAATIGVQVDILIRKYTKLDVGYAAVLQAVGAMFVESYVECLVKRFESDAAKDSLRLRPRFSPGYGDLSLTVQKDIFTALTPEKIGLSLMESLIMAPEKSVTAFVGAC